MRSRHICSRIGTAVETVQRLLETGIARAPLAARPVAGEASIAIEVLRVSEALTGEHLRVTLRYRNDEPRRVFWNFNIWTGDSQVCVTGATSPEPRALERGSGELTCVIPRLPLLAGRYVLRAALVDPENLYPVAMYGWHDPGLPLEVRSAADAVTNAQVRMGQLVRVDADWA